jgi:hypothetical protein
MVLLAITPVLVDVVQLYLDNATTKSLDDEPPLKDPAEGQPISHAQVIEIAKWMSSKDGKSKIGEKNVPLRLNDLLKGCRIYQPPKEEPKAQVSFLPVRNDCNIKADLWQSLEYKRLMARLRKEEEARSYERMTNPQSTSESFSQRFPNSRYGTIFPVQSTKADEDDEITFAEVKRQATLIINVLVSVICTAVFLWIAARRWSVEARLALAMIGALVVAIAEVVIFGGYLRRLKEAKQVERKKVEIKTVESTWIIEAKSSAKENGVRARQPFQKSDVHI